MSIISYISPENRQFINKLIVNFFYPGVSFFFFFFFSEILLIKYQCIKTYKENCSNQILKMLFQCTKYCLDNRIFLSALFTGNYKLVLFNSRDTWNYNFMTNVIKFRQFYWAIAHDRLGTRVTHLVRCTFVEHVKHITFCLYNNN